MGRSATDKLAGRRQVCLSKCRRGYFAHAQSRTDCFVLECVPLAGKTADLESNHSARGQTRLILEALHASLALPYGTSANRKGLQPFLLFNTSSRKSVNAETLVFFAMRAIGASCQDARAIKDRRCRPTNSASTNSNKFLSHVCLMQRLQGLHKMHSWATA